MVLSTRHDLARLWLPWCVARDERSVPITHMPAEHPSALQLRMTDLDDQATQRALAWQRLGTDTSWERSTDTSWERIVRRAHEFEHRASAGKQLVVGPNPANPGQDPGLYEFDGVQMLREPCHRECSLYVAGWTRSG